MHPSAFGLILYYLLTAFVVVLFARFILSFVVSAGGYRPTGKVAVLFEVVYSVTDPVLRPLDRVIPPLRIGNVSIGLSMLIVFLAVGILRGVVLQF